MIRAHDNVSVGVYNTDSIPILRASDDMCRPPPGFEELLIKDIMEDSQAKKFAQSLRLVVNVTDDGFEKLRSRKSLTIVGLHSICEWVTSV